LAECIFITQNNKNYALCQKTSPEISMRKILSEQVQMGELDIAAIQIELNSRDEIPDILRGLQYLYANESARRKVFRLLWKLVPEGTDINNGRSGMNLWRILVLGTLRLTCNWDFDKLQEIANNHIVLRQMLGHGILDFKQRYPRQTLNDNIRLFTPDVLDQINQIAVNEGLKLLGAPAAETSHSRCDSFVVETDVHFPTDINLLWDGTRKASVLSQRVALAIELDGWRQAEHNLRKVKRLFRAAQNERNRDKESDQCVQTIQQYINAAMVILDNATIVAEAAIADPLHVGTGAEIQRFVAHGKKQIDLICRRCFKQETIPHNEKVHSLFEEYTEWISKGKAGVPQELGLRVCIMESATGFILHHHVMEQQTDDTVAVSMVKETLQRFECVRSCSFDKGFHSPDNQEKLAKMLKICVLPRKGRLREDDKAREHSPEFVEKRRRHSAVESAINAIENHGLDRCLDHGLDGFKRYVALAVVARNIQLIGKIVQSRQLAEAEQLRKAA
jgi:IS5 family transposase